MNSVLKRQQYIKKISSLVCLCSPCALLLRSLITQIQTSDKGCLSSFSPNLQFWIKSLLTLIHPAFTSQIRLLGFLACSDTHCVLLLPSLLFQPCLYLSYGNQASVLTLLEIPSLVPAWCLPSTGTPTFDYQSQSQGLVSGHYLESSTQTEFSGSQSYKYMYKFMNSLINLSLSLSILCASSP